MTSSVSCSGFSKQEQHCKNFKSNFVNYSSVVDAQGYSCSSYIEPTNRFLTFQGESFANYSRSFNFYLLPDPTLENDASSHTLPAYFDSQTNQALANFYTAAANAGVGFLNNFMIDYQFSQQEAFTSSGPVVMPIIIGFDEEVEVIELNGTIKMSNIQLSSEGTVYAIAREIGQVIPDPEDEFSSIEVPTRIHRTPTNEQINNCVDWNNEPADACAKAVIANDEDVALLLKDLKPNKLYVVYYTVANEYPIQPIFSNEIVSFTVKVLWGGIISSGFIVLTTFFICLF